MSLMDELVKHSYVSILPSLAFTFGFGFLPSLFFCFFLLTCFHSSPCVCHFRLSDKDPNVFKVLAKRLYGKLFADKGYISQKLFDFLFEDGIQLVTGLRVNMKNKLMPFYDRMMLRKRYIIETINDMLKNTAQIVHSRHRSVSNFIMNLISALGAYCFFDNKPKALQGYCIENTKQLS